MELGLADCCPQLRPEALADPAVLVIMSTCYWHRKEKHVTDFFAKEAGYFRMTLKI
jgi:hypothetical protein